MNLKYHHTGIVVKSIDEASLNYKKIFGENCLSQKYFISTQDVNVCFVDTGANTFLELVEMVGENSVVTKLIKKGITYYHIAYTTSDFEKAVEELEALNYKTMPNFKSEAFHGKRCVFLYSPDAHLIELIEV